MIKKLSPKKLRVTLNVNKYQITIRNFKNLMRTISNYFIYAITDNIGLFNGLNKLNQIKDIPFRLLVTKSFVVKLDTSSNHLTN